ncbi:TetR/AcrR family transcriptional regulator [Kineosporia sp. J2-2]|uniref:TetR/AcrR family transcriptional regulator n=1 Tax=Kineosporia corallincola TaxID=2835133 RepID=A0ABS5TGL3_9ACTN|nr:TetR/AcrR family transcriptional regulator [Kineosporia corallincola]MBT0770238.1 TetR/AcrR family transcriptional regulator [Kineosporia corallincola]
MTATPPLAERKRREARRRIIEAADELFLTRGFDHVSVTDIAERAEVGRTTFFRHFGDKQEVVFARQQELFDAITSATQQETTSRTGTATEALRQLQPLFLQLCERLTADADGYERHYRLIEQHPELRARNAVKNHQIADLFADLLARRGFEPAVARFAAETALACYQTARRLDGGPHTMVAQVGAAFDQALRLGSEPGDA